LIEYVEEHHIKQALENIDKTTKENVREEAKALLIMLYYTGCRPSEALITKSKQIEKDGRYIKIKLKTLKRGRARVLWISPNKFPLIKILYNWHLKKYYEELLFFHFIGKYYHKRKWKKKINVMENGELKKLEMPIEKEYIDLASKLPYYFKRWFKGVIDINPYYLRHNKFSKLAEKAKITDRGLMQMKGSKTYSSIDPYIRFSEEFGKKMATKGG